MICLLLTSQISTRGRRSNSTFSTVILNGLQVGGERLVLNLPNKSFDKKTLNLILRKDSLKNYFKHCLYFFCLSKKTALVMENACIVHSS